ncbi:LAFE_0B11782g1_1 [Lachancea fermentati]|uniref:LAFE_0B11782g1_1 n=1 Tax=Lachancea fermentati TaxID=4955 RepID=A0A1G4M8N6_LACFM|nr:LAFE_0B11782g1_1 [Lachancea fermentati]
MESISELNEHKKMTTNGAVDHLILILNLSHYQDDRTSLLKNLAYYTPRIRSKVQLKRLINSIIESHIWLPQNENGVLSLFELTEAIFHWKLEISEPVISIRDFYDIWDSGFRRCHSWTTPKLALLCGVLSTESKFERLQSTLFIDDSGSVHFKYREWRSNLLLPIFSELFHASHNSQSLNEMCLIYAPLCREGDIKHIPNSAVTRCLFNLSTEFMLGKDQKNSFLARHINSIANALHLLLTWTEHEVVTQVLKVICSLSFELSIKELNNPKKDYSVKPYSDVLLTIVLILQGCASRLDLPYEWAYEIVISLFYINYLVHDFGVVGFSNYEHIHDVSIAGVTITSSGFYNVLSVMRGNLWSLSGNKVNDSRVLFVLTFLEQTLAKIPIDSDKLKNIVAPLISHYLDFPNGEILETAHSAYLALFTNRISMQPMDQWKFEHAIQYIDQSTMQFMQKILSSSQLVLIYRTVASQLPYLKYINDDLGRQLLQYTYLKILNCKTLDEKSTLIECLICQVMYTDERFLRDWLDNCLELLSTCQGRKKELLDKLWKTIMSSGQNEAALDWWYSVAMPLQCNL